MSANDTSGSPDTPSEALRLQWSNPGDILSLLLLIGGDIVQKALAQFAGVKVPLFHRESSLSLTPVAFSFGWVAYTFMSLTSIFGDNQLLPEPDCKLLVVNCSNAYVRENRSWALGRILRDHEATHEVDKEKGVAMRIDIFDALGVHYRPDIDYLWVFGWIVILAQQVIAVIPWILYGDWAIFLVTVCGTFGALVTGALPQWLEEKWPGRVMRKGKRKIVALTRGNGHPHVMVIVSDGKGWDLESMATAIGMSRPGTRIACVILTAWWTLLLITVSGLEQNTWFLIVIGGLGMLQNIYAAGARRKEGAFNVHLKPHDRCPTIIATRPAQSQERHDDPDSDEESAVDETHREIRTTGNGGVMGALMKLETELPRAGASLLTVYFPGGLKYDSERLVYNNEKRFWKRAFRQMGLPVPRRSASSDPTTASRSAQSIKNDHVAAVEKEQEMDAQESEEVNPNHQV